MKSLLLILFFLPVPIIPMTANQILSKDFDFCFSGYSNVDLANEKRSIDFDFSELRNTDVQNQKDSSKVELKKDRKKHNADTSKTEERLAIDAAFLSFKEELSGYYFDFGVSISGESQFITKKIVVIIAHLATSLTDRYGNSLSITSFGIMYEPVFHFTNNPSTFFGKFGFGLTYTFYDRSGVYLMSEDFGFALDFSIGIKLGRFHIEGGFYGFYDVNDRKSYTNGLKLGAGLTI